MSVRRGFVRLTVFHTLESRLNGSRQRNTVHTVRQKDRMYLHYSFQFRNPVFRGSPRTSALQQRGTLSVYTKNWTQ